MFDPWLNHQFEAGGLICFSEVIKEGCTQSQKPVADVDWGSHVVRVVSATESKHSEPDMAKAPTHV